MDIYNNELVISTVMMCISISDPLSNPDTQEWKKQVAFLLTKIKDTYSQYLKKVEASTAENRFGKMPLVLMSLKIALVRSLPVFSSFDHNVTFFAVKAKIDQVIEDFKGDEFNAETDLKMLHEIKASLTQMLSNISFVENPQLG